MKCWGSNTDGNLGLGDVQARGRLPGEMGDNLPYVDLGTGRTATEIYIGLSNTCARLDNGVLRCWGLDSSGQLLLGSAANIGDEPGEMGDALVSPNFGTGRSARDIALGAGHVCALLDDGRVKCWGGSPVGQLGLGDTVPRGDNAGEMGNALPFVSVP